MGSRASTRRLRFQLDECWGAEQTSVEETAKSLMKFRSGSPGPVDFGTAQFKLQKLVRNPGSRGRPRENQF